MQYNLAVVTGTRAEYGLLSPVLNALDNSSVINTQLIVTGAHLAKEFGNTVNEIIAHNRTIYKSVPILHFGTGTPYATAKTVAYTIDEFTNVFTENRPDAVLVLGDRYEIFAVSTAAAILEIPLIHISGGDVTLGAADDFFRHSITKMAALHFPSCEEYAKRVIRMGENPTTVHNVGGLGDENLRSLALLSKEELQNSINFDVTNPYALVTYHPETIGGALPQQQFKSLINALAKFDIGCIFTKANADAGGDKINKIIDEICQNNAKYIAFTSMGVLRYLSAMKYCSAVIGNSSSGVVETPSLGVPTVNIGTRQKGRIICPNVICCNQSETEIEKAITKALSPEFAKIARKTISPYNGGNTSQKIVSITEQFFQSGNYKKPKTFYDDV